MFEYVIYLVAFCCPTSQTVKTYAISSFSVMEKKNERAGVSILPISFLGRRAGRIPLLCFRKVEHGFLATPAYKQITSIRRF